MDRAGAGEKCWNQVCAIARSISRNHTEREAAGLSEAVDDWPAACSAVIERSKGM
jgi:hypothetical protein